VTYSVRSVEHPVVSREVPCLDDLSRSSRNDKVLVRRAFQSHPRPVGFAWKSLHESGSPSLLKGCVVREAVHPHCSRPSPVGFTDLVRQLPPRGGGINGLGLMPHTVLGRRTWRAQQPVLWQWYRPHCVSDQILPSETLDCHRWR